MICKNCSHRYHGKYCNVYGQKWKVARLTWKQLANYLPHAILHMDRGILFTLKQMTIRPGHTLRDYLEGKRVNHMNPFLFIFIMAGFTSFIYDYYDLPTFLGKVIIGEVKQSFPLFGAKYHVFTSLMYVPWLILSYKLMFWKYKYNVPEYFVLFTFYFGYVFSIILVFCPLLIYFKGTAMYAVLGYFIFGIGIYCQAFLTLQFFNQTKRWMLVLKTIILLILGMIMMALMGEFLSGLTT